MLNELFKKIKIEWLDRLDPDNAYLKQAVRTGLAVFVALILFRWQKNWLQGYWIVLAAAFLLQTKLGDTQTEQITTLCICTIIAATFAFAIGFFWQHTLWLAACLSLTTFIATYLAVLGLNVAIAAFFVNLFVIMSAGLPSVFAGQIERSLMIGLGGIIAICVCFLWPVRLSENWDRASKIYLFCLAELNDALGKSYLHQDYHRKKNYFENILHERRNRALRFLNSLKHIDKVSADRSYSVFVEQAAHLFEAITALGNIRHRFVLEDRDALLDIKIDMVHREVSECLKQISLNKRAFNFQKLTVSIGCVQENITSQSIELQKVLYSFVHTANNLEKMLKILYSNNRLCSSS